MTHPAVRDLFHTLSRDSAFQDLAAKLVRRDAGPFSLSGLTPTAKALYLVLLWQVTERPMLVVADNNQHAENENIRLTNLWSGIESMAAIMRLK